jgi:hypothetical protein
LPLATFKIIIKKIIIIIFYFLFFIYLFFFPDFDLALGLALAYRIASLALAIINIQRPTLIPLVYSNPFQCFFAPTIPNHTFKLLEHGQTMPRLVISPQVDSCTNFHT